MSIEQAERQIIDEIGRLVSELVSVRHVGDDPFVKGWALAAITQTADQIEDNAERTEYVAPPEQSIALTVGLHAIAARHTMDDD